MTRRLVLPILFVLCLMTLALPQSKGAPQESKPAKPVLSEKTKLEIRDLQHRADRILLQIQELQHQLDQVNGQISNTVEAASKEQKVDLNKFVLNDNLEFVERPAEKK